MGIETETSREEEKRRLGRKDMETGPRNGREERERKGEEVERERRTERDKYGKKDLEA